MKSLLKLLMPIFGIFSMILLCSLDLKAKMPRVEEMANLPVHMVRPPYPVIPPLDLSHLQNDGPPPMPAPREGFIRTPREGVDALKTPESD